MSLNDEKKKGRPLNALDVSLDNWRTKFNNKKRNAFNLNRDFELEFSENTIQALIFKSHGLCYYTGLRFLNAEDVTFDRIDPNKGYSFDNVVICTSYANGIKGTHYDAPIHNGNPPIMPELARAGFLPGAMAMLNEIIRPSVKVHNLYAVIFRLEDGSRHHDMICHGVEHLKSVLKCHGSNILKDIDIYKYESCVSSENWETILPKMTDDFIEKRIINHPFKTLEGRESHYTGFLDHLNKWRKVVPQLPSNIDLASAIGCLWLAMQKEAKVVQVVRDATKDLENNPITKPLYYRELSRSGKTTRNYAYSDFRLVEDSTCETVWLVK